LHFSPGTESRFARDLFGLGNFETSSAGAFITVVENSTKPVTTRGTRAGIAIVDQFNMQHAVTIICKAEKTRRSVALARRGPYRLLVYRWT
jgi:hypothetical protein